MKPELEKAWEELVDRLETGGRFSDPRIRKALLDHPRWRFLPDDADPSRRREALKDKPVSIAQGQTISAPHMVAILLSNASPQPGEHMLEVGAGSGWLAILAGELVSREGRVVGVEIVPELVELARSNVQQNGAENVEIVRSDGSLGYAREAPYDVIVVSCAAPEVSQALVDQLAVGGRLVVPVGKQIQQRLVRITRTADGVERENLGGCAFVPLVGEEGFDKPNR